MTKAEIKAAVEQMQAKRRPSFEIRQNPNGTFSHHMDGKREWQDLDGCEIDLRFCREWAR